MMKTFAKYVGIMSVAVAVGVSGNALAQQAQGQQAAYYPLTIATLDPATGAQQMHTIYVPVQAMAQSAVTAAQAQQQVQTQQTQQAALPANPWAAQSQAQVQAVADALQQDVPLRDTPLPQFVGQNTTYNTAMGQEMIAPEINKTNMLLMTEHLRKLGYIVPDSLDEAIRTAPEKTRLALVQSTRWIQKGGDANSSPILEAIGKISKDLENNYGFSFENILDNSMRILDSK